MRQAVRDDRCSKDLHSNQQLHRIRHNRRQEQQRQEQQLRIRHSIREVHIEPLQELARKQLEEFERILCKELVRKRDELS